MYTALKWLLLVASVGFFVYQWHTFEVSVFQAITDGWQTNLPLILAVFFLMMLNWFIEGVKFKILLITTKRVSYIQAFATVLGGMTVSNFTPARTGEYIGRSVLLKNISPIKIVIATVTGNIAQLMCTYTLGIVALLFLGQTSLLGNRWVKALYVTILLLGVVLAYWKRAIWIPLVAKKLPKKWIKKFRFLNHYNRYLLIKVVALSVFRYLIFSTQYFLLLSLFSITKFPFSEFLKIPVAFLLQSIVPVPAVSDVGVRVYVAQLLFSPIISKPEALYATTSLWFINLIFPAFLGTIYLIYKLIKK